MAGLEYSEDFVEAMFEVANELLVFFEKIPETQPSLGEYRKNLRHLTDLERFKETLQEIEAGNLSLGRVTIGSILSTRKIYILTQGPWRGYFKKNANGTFLALEFVDCR